jgi:predicted transcriptional regulator
MLQKLFQYSIKIDSTTYTCSDLLRCLFNLNDTDLQVFNAIPEQGGTTIEKITSLVKKDRSTVHRSLEKLIACALCFKERRSGRTRGFLDYYYAAPMKEILQRAEQHLDTCYHKFKEIIRKEQEAVKA